MGATIVYPDRERLEWEFEFEDRLARKWVESGRLRATTYDELEKGGRDVNAIFICRSGAWTPPWDDKKFMQLVSKTPNVGQMNDHFYLKEIFGQRAVDTVHPEEIRDWSRRDAVAMGEQQKEQMDEFRRKMEMTRSDGS